MAKNMFVSFRTAMKMQASADCMDLVFSFPITHPKGRSVLVTGPAWAVKAAFRVAHPNARRGDARPMAVFCECCGLEPYTPKPRPWVMELPS